MIRIKGRIKEAVKFHGHLGPYLVLGLLAGDYALKKIKCKRYFGLSVEAWGVDKKPKSCLIDGLQLSTGATYGKGNIKKHNGGNIKIEINDRYNKKKVILSLKKDLLKRLEKAKTHSDSEILAGRLFKENYFKLFNLTLNP